METFLVKCPACGGQLRAEVGIAVCEYCNQSIAVRESGMAALKSAQEAQGEPGANAPWLTAIFPVIALVLVVVVLLFRSRHSDHDPIANRNTSSSSVLSHAPTAAFESQQNESAEELHSGAPRMQWKSRWPIVVDTDGDGLPEVVGSARDASKAIRAVALSGEDGSILWTTDVLPSRQGGAVGPLFLCGESVIATGSAGELSAYRLDDGSTRWEIRFGEAVAVVVMGDDHQGKLVVRLKDRSFQRVDVETGRVEPAQTGDAAMSFTAMSTGTAERRGGRGSRMGIGESRMPSGDALEGLEVRGVSYADDGTFSIASAVPERGSEVPFLARYRFERGATRDESTLEEFWRTQVPKTDPLLTHGSFGSPEHVHASQELAVVAFVSTQAKRAEPARLAGFAMEDGQRLWEVPVPHQASLRSVIVMHDRAYIVTSDGVHVLDGLSGALLWEVETLPVPGEAHAR